MANRFLHYDPKDSKGEEIQYDDEETEDDGFDFSNSAPTFPFFQTSDPALRAAYSYGDPRGGSYPDPTIHQLRPSAPLEDVLTTDTLAAPFENQAEVFEDSDFDALLGQI